MVAGMTDGGGRDGWWWARRLVVGATGGGGCDGWLGFELGLVFAVCSQPIPCSAAPPRYRGRGWLYCLTYSSGLFALIPLQLLVDHLLVNGVIADKQKYCQSVTGEADTPTQQGPYEPEIVRGGDEVNDG